MIFLKIITLIFLIIIPIYLNEEFGILKKQYILKKYPYADNEGNKYYINLWIHKHGTEFYQEDIKIKIYDSKYKKVWFNCSDLSKWKNNYKDFVEHNFINFRKEKSVLLKNIIALENL